MLRRALARLLGLRTPPGASVENRDDGGDPDDQAWIVNSTPNYFADSELNALFGDPRFWSGYFNWTWEDEERDQIEAAFGVGDEVVVPFWNDLSGWYDGILDETDGDLEHPRTIRMAFHGARQLDVEFHAGAIYYRMRGQDRVEDLGVLGPHESLPGLPWSEIRTMASAAERGADHRRDGIPYPAALLLLAPLVRPVTDDASLETIETDLAAAIDGLGVASVGHGAALAAAWIRVTFTDAD